MGDWRCEMGDGRWEVGGGRERGKREITVPVRAPARSAIMLHKQEYIDSNWLLSLSHRIYSPRRLDIENFPD